MRILCGIVSYEPNTQRLKENINAIIDQVDYIYIFDNGSTNIEEIKEIEKNHVTKVTVKRSRNNIGIAAALYDIMNYAIENDFEWVISLDQDSVVKAGLINEYKKYISYPNIGGMTCQIKDRNIDSSEFLSECQNVKEVVGCITSGFFLSVEAYKKTSGYDKEMFIDSVDYDICNALRRKGFKIIKIPFLGLLHELGRSKLVKWGNRNILIYNHSAFRKFYISRNAIYEARKYKEYYCLTREIWYRIKDLFRILIFEEDKLNKIFQSIKGIIMGFKMKVDKNVSDQDDI